MESARLTQTIDFEVTNRCNAKCHFCPRDQTPHQGLMSPEVFEQALIRAVEYRDVLMGSPLDIGIAVSLCGLGEPLLNRHLPEYVRAVKAEGFTCQVSTNGALLDEQRGGALLAAGVDEVCINAGEQGEDYEEIYKLPFDKTRDNIMAFARAAKEANDVCTVHMVLVDHRGDPEHLTAMRQYWGERGITHFIPYGMINRGGALLIEDMQFETMPELSIARAALEEVGGHPLCGAPFAYVFVGYDGLYYLCCSDWKKEVPLGSVFDRSVTDTIAEKLGYTAGRGSVCRSCNHDPSNQAATLRRVVDAGGGTLEEFESLLGSTIVASRNIESALEAIKPGVTDGLTWDDPNQRRLIPVTST